MQDPSQTTNTTQLRQDQRAQVHRGEIVPPHYDCFYSTVTTTTRFGSDVGLGLETEETERFFSQEQCPLLFLEQQQQQQRQLLPSSNVPKIPDESDNAMKCPCYPWFERQGETNFIYRTATQSPMLPVDDEPPWVVDMIYPYCHQTPSVANRQGLQRPNVENHHDDRSSPGEQSPLSDYVHEREIVGWVHHSHLYFWNCGSCFWFGGFLPTDVFWQTLFCCTEHRQHDHWPENLFSSEIIKPQPFFVKLCWIMLMLLPACLVSLLSCILPLFCCSATILTCRGWLCCQHDICGLSFENSSYIASDNYYSCLEGTLFHRLVPRLFYWEKSRVQKNCC